MYYITETIECFDISVKDWFSQNEIETEYALSVIECTVHWIVLNTENISVLNLRNMPPYTDYMNNPETHELKCLDLF
jgi:hypothetical protein